MSWTRSDITRVSVDVGHALQPSRPQSLAPPLRSSFSSVRRSLSSPWDWSSASRLLLTRSSTSTKPSSSFSTLNRLCLFLLLSACVCCYCCSRCCRSAVVVVIIIFVVDVVVVVVVVVCRTVVVLLNLTQAIKFAGNFVFYVRLRNNRCSSARASRRTADGSGMELYRFRYSDANSEGHSSCLLVVCQNECSSSNDGYDKWGSFYMGLLQDKRHFVTVSLSTL